MSAGDGAGRSTLADAASTTFASDNPNTRAVIRAMSTRETLSGPPMLNVLFSFDVSDASNHRGDDANATTCAAMSRAATGTATRRGRT